MTTEIVLTLAEAGADDLRLDDLTRLLRGELIEIPEATSVEPVVADDAPEGTRSGLVTAAGALLITAQPQVTAMLKIVTSVWAWLRRGEGGGSRTVRLEVGGDVIELHGATNELQEKLVADWIARNAPAG